MSPRTRRRIAHPLRTFVAHLRLNRIIMTSLRRDDPDTWARIMAHRALEPLM